ncbi:MAG: CRISPR-associated protein [Acidobacteriia bacterium]|nr:CRISPR-associated protein [Terriglobia bacterium]
MTGKPLAHSARPKRGILAQGFWEHINRVANGAAESARNAVTFWSGNRESFCAEVEAAARFHDCGKLAPENQEVLARSSKDRLPIRHEDGGTAWLLAEKRRQAALLVASHHAGLPSKSEESAKRLYKPAGEMYRFTDVIEHTERHLANYAAQYGEAGLATGPAPPDSGKWSGLAHRVALSCLVDADHSDTARHYSEAVPKKPADCRWAERVKALDVYVEGLSARRSKEARNQDRRDVYEQCRDQDGSGSIMSCDAAVGTGKTTAVMAHLLRVAAERELRHIFVVLPYTNIIQQSVDVYRKALVLPGEDPTEVVAEVHHRAEFQSPELREMSVLWDAPITVTTAVQFFETLAGNKPARVRKLHELPGSAVFVDEAHAAIPIWLWPQTWLWLKELANEWGCHFVLASGSLAKFWEIPGIVQAPETVPDLLTPEIRTRLGAVEQQRIKVESHPVLLNCDELAQFVAEKPGPRLVILNTVQSAAVLANSMRKKGYDVLHLSTALAPDHREIILRRIQARLKFRNCFDWTLVATSCVEAGVDFSFRNAVRESCSVASMIQTGGRVNRHSEWADSEVWDVRLQDPMFNWHPAFEASRCVLGEMLQNREIGVDASGSVTEALRRELVRRDVGEKSEKLLKAEAAEEFPGVEELYSVIDSDTQTVVVDPELVRRLEDGERLQWRDLLRGSIQVWRHKVQDLAVKRLDYDDDLFVWTGVYDPDFLGYMAGVLPLIEGRATGVFG